jgi:hypothetical protein
LGVEQILITRGVSEMKSSSPLWRLTIAVCLSAFISLGFANPKANLIFSGFHEEVGLPLGIDADKAQAMRWVGVSLEPCEMIETGVRFIARDKSQPTLDVEVIATTRPKFNGFFVDAIQLKPGSFDCVKNSTDPLANFVGSHQIDPPPGSGDSLAYAFKKKAILVLNGQAATLELVRESKQMSAVLSVGQLRQSLVVFQNGIDSATFSVFDIDRDGKVDVLCSYQTAIEASFSVLYLSSLAPPGMIVGEAATEPQ